MAALPGWNDKDFELFGQIDLEGDDILSCTGQTVHSAAVESSASQQRKRRSNAGPRPDKAKHHASEGMSVTSDSPPSFVSVTSSAATPAMRGRSTTTTTTANTTVVSAEPLPDGTRLIPDWYAVLGDKQSGGRGRTTTATSLLRDVKEWYKEQKPVYRDEGRLHALMDDALKRYFDSVAETFPCDFPADEEQRKQTILIYCSKEALQSGRVAESNCFTYEQGKPAKFGLATVPAAISFFLESRDAPSLPSVVRKLRRDFDALRVQDGVAPPAMIAHFEGLLQFCEMQLQAAASQEMAQILLNKLNLIPALREQWKFLKEHAAANGKSISGGRSVASAKSSGYNGGKDDDDSTMGGGRSAAGRSRSAPNTTKEQGKKTASSRKAAAQRMKARQPHDYRTFSHTPASFTQGPFITMQTQQDDASEYSESNYSGSYWSGQPSTVVSENSRTTPLPPYQRQQQQYQQQQFQQRALDEESLTDVDGWQAGHRSNNNMEDDEGSYQIGGVHRTMRDDSLRNNANGGMEINVMRSFHDSASAVSAVSSVTAATAMLRMEEDEKSAASSHQYYSSNEHQAGGAGQDDSWNQRALSKLNLDNASQQGMDDSGGGAPRFNIGSSSNDSVTSSNSRGGTSSRRSRSRPHVRRGGRRASRHGASGGGGMMAASGPTPPAQPVANVYHVTTISVVDPHGDHGLYTGSISNESGMPHGFGRFEFLKGGRWYEGNWVHGHWTGQGKLSNGDGSHYDGGFQDDLKHGQGVMVWSDGRVFDGIYNQGQMTYGKMKFADGGTYFGCFVDGLQHGKGNMIFADNSKYEGDFERGNFHGQGKMVWNDGGYYDGEWMDGMIHGIGKEVRADGSLRHEGNWKNGAPVR